MADCHLNFFFSLSIKFFDI